MAKYIKKFDNHAAYEAAQSGLILPNVSVCVQENDVHYNPYLPPTPHDYIEIGGVKWATMNIGANSITDIGLLFQWGDTQGYTAEQVGSGESKKQFNENHYKWYDSTEETYTKYSGNDGLIELESSDDAVTINWGNNWRMPTIYEIESLCNNSTQEVVSNYEGSNVSGVVFTSIQDPTAKLFFPFGAGVDTNFDDNFFGYWSNLISINCEIDSAMAMADDYSSFGYYELFRYYGLPVRGVLKEEVHPYVEIGGIKWAKMNVGANSITDTGLYFQWGDTQGYTAAQVGSGEGKKYFGLDDCIYYNDGSYTKYNETDGLSTLQLSDDAVSAALGGNWRMPTASEYIALGEAVDTAWTADYESSGVAGLVCTDKTDSSKVLFFPAAGDCYNGRVRRGGGRYWSSSADAHCGYQTGFNVSFSDGGVDWITNLDERCYGKLVRGVLDE